MNPISKLLPKSIKSNLLARQHLKSVIEREIEIPETGDQNWQVTLEEFPSAVDSLEGLESIITLRRKGDTLENTSLALAFQFTQWTRDHYVFMPAAAYNGNRFPVNKQPYPPLLDEGNCLEFNARPVITDIPRLNDGEGLSQMVQLTRDCTTPLIGVWDPHEKVALFLVVPAQTRFGDYGFEVEESDDRKTASVRLSLPGVRPDTRYSFCSTSDVESPDRGISIPAGLNISLRVQVYCNPCENMRDFYAQFSQVRYALSGERTFRNELPYSAAWSILEQKYNTENWYEDEGYYRVGSYDDNPVPSQDWQIGWIGGLQFTLPQIAQGNEETQKRALRNINFCLSKLISPSGFLHGGWSKGKPWGDNFKDTSQPWVMVRKEGDALYFLLKIFNLLEKRGQGSEIPENWKRAVQGIAEAFKKLWETHGQWGQFADLNSGKLLVGGSTSGGIIPGALALAAEYFNQPKYLEIAKTSAKQLVNDHAAKGFTTGGPGEILQCPDSESAFGLFESLVMLYESTGDSKWLDDARFLGHHCESWCVSYDYPFPAESEFGKLDMKSRGSVWASVQNKHSAPGICTFSGDALLKLFRATGDETFLNLAQEIAHNITQYLSREDRRIRGFKITDVGNYDTMFPTPAGWMSERVQLSDFSEPTGEIFAGSCWCETSCMLTTLEIPGLYIMPDKGRVIAFDNVSAEWLPSEESKGQILIENSTGFDATVSFVIESAEQRAVAWSSNPSLEWKKIQVPAHSKRILNI